MGEKVLLEGRVTEIDSTPMFVDGDGLIYLRGETYGNVIVRIPARERVCKAQGLETFSSIRAGDSIRALGEVTGRRHVTVCAENEHFLEKLD